MRAPLAAALLLACTPLLPGCGTGLYDAAGVPSVDGAGLTCVEGQVPCANTCVAETVAHCGTCDNDCSATSSPPARGQLACISSLCDFECLDGYLKCGGACCATTALAAGPASTCALLEDGSVRCWGANTAGQLGDGTTIDRAAPVTVAPLPATTAVAIGVGDGHACAVMTGGAVFCWGANDSGQVTGATTSGPVHPPAATPVTSDATAVVAGSSHTCALLGSGAVTCWGSSALGQLGPGGAPVVTGAGAVAAGANHTCALVGGAVTCWGDNGSGQLGDGTTSPRAGTFSPIATGLTAVAAFAGQTCATRGLATNDPIDDVVKCWGDSLGATFGFAAPQPTPAIPMKNGTQSTIRGDDVTLLTAGRRHVCYQKKAESVSCFGSDNTFGQLGGMPAGPAESVTVPIPVTVPAAAAIAAGADHTCAALGDGRLRCWGANDRGQLGGDPILNPIVTPSGR